MMAMSLYEASVGSYRQTVAAVAGFLELGRVHCREQGIDLAQVVESRLHADMLPFRFQVQSVAAHSLGAVAAIRSGVFAVVEPGPGHDYAALQTLVGQTLAALEQVAPEEIERHAGGEVVFAGRTSRRRFTTEGFLMSFSLPNLHFHATTAYDLLRGRGVPLGKRDYMGEFRLKA